MGFRRRAFGATAVLCSSLCSFALDLQNLLALTGFPPVGVLRLAALLKQDVLGHWGGKVLERRSKSSLLPLQPPLAQHQSTLLWVGSGRFPPGGFL